MNEIDYETFIKIISIYANIFFSVFGVIGVCIAIASFLRTKNTEKKKDINTFYCAWQLFKEKNINFTVIEYSKNDFRIRVYGLNLYNQKRWCEYEWKRFEKFDIEIFRKEMINKYRELDKLKNTTYMNIDTFQLLHFIDSISFDNFIEYPYKYKFFDLYINVCLFEISRHNKKHLKACYELLNLDICIKNKKLGNAVGNLYHILGGEFYSFIVLQNQGLMFDGNFYFEDADKLINRISKNFNIIEEYLNKNVKYYRPYKWPIIKRLAVIIYCKCRLYKIFRLDII